MHVDLGATHEPWPGQTYSTVVCDDERMTRPHDHDIFFERNDHDILSLLRFNLATAGYTHTFVAGRASAHFFFER